MRTSIHLASDYDHGRLQSLRSRSRCEALRCLENYDGVCEEGLIAKILETDPLSLAGFYFALDQLCREGALTYALWSGKEKIMSFRPIGENRPRASNSAPNNVYRLSRFAFFRPDNQGWLLECPKVRGVIRLHSHHALVLASSLSCPISDLAAVEADPLGKAVFTFLSRTNVLVAEAAENELPYWEFHDLLFHTRSRNGRHDYPSGGTYRFGSQGAPPAVAPLPLHTASIALGRFDKAEEVPGKVSLDEAQRNRRSRRSYGDRPITVLEVGELLFRVARIERLLDQVEVNTPHGRARLDFALRPYPSGGALYEQEFYLCVQNCEGIEKGFYRYDGKTHSLLKLRDFDDSCLEMIRMAAWCIEGDSTEVQILITISARFPRLQWKYASAAYAAMLKNVGVIIANFYLRASAMGLAMCANGQGDSDLFSRLTGLDYFLEGSIGELVVGSPSEARRVD